MLLAYKDGRVSLSKFSKTLKMTLSEALDFLASAGFQASINYNDYLEGLQTARKAIH